MIHLTDEEIQSLINARVTLDKINAHPYIINKLDKILNDISTGWLEHILERMNEGGQDMEELMKLPFITILLSNTPLKDLVETNSTVKTLMSSVLLDKNSEDGNYRPVKGTTKIECFNVLGQIQKLLKTNRV